MMVKIIPYIPLPNNKTEKLKIYKYNNVGITHIEDYIALERPLEIRLGDKSNKFQTLSITMCSPDNCEDLVYGYLFTENIIQTKEQIINIELFNNELGLIAEILLDKSASYIEFLNKRHGMVHASCGVCGKTEIDDLLTFNYAKIQKPEINSDVIQSLPQNLNQAQDAFKQTGGIHASALFNAKGDLLILKEDIGRHNALDKLIGAALQQDLLPLHNYIILLSGRVSFELVHKSLMAGVSTLAAIGAPSSLSIETANINQMNLVGFVKPDGFNLYGE